MIEIMKISPKRIGKLIRDARRNMVPAMSQADLGYLCGFGSDAQSRISHYERGVRSPGLEDLEKIAKALNVSLVDFLGALDDQDAGALLDPEIISLLSKIKPAQKAAALTVLRGMVDAGLVAKRVKKKKKAAFR